MRALITGVAGVIGATLAERLLREGHQVVGIDSFTDYYPRWIKERNLAPLQPQPAFSFIEGDLVDLDLALVMANVEWEFYHAAQTVVRASWGASFDVYTHDNIQATQRLLEAAKGTALRKFIYASSSSIYGDAESFPTPETTTPLPVSPYCLTKLAAEQLCHLYWRNYEGPCEASP